MTDLMQLMRVIVKLEEARNKVRSVMGAEKYNRHAGPRRVILQGIMEAHGFDSPFEAVLEAKNDLMREFGDCETTTMELRWLLCAACDLAEVG